MGSRLFAQDLAPFSQRVDVHHHFFTATPLSRKYWAHAPTPAPILEYTPSRSLEAMDKGGVSTAYLSCPVPFGDDRIEDRRDARSWRAN